MKHVLPKLKASNQTVYVKNRCISESERFISGATEMCDTLDIPGCLVTMDIEKMFDSLDHVCTFGFRENFIYWIKVVSTIMDYKWRIYNSVF